MIQKVIAKARAMFDDADALGAEMNETQKKLFD
jgi:hypothetical protein